MVQGLGLQRLEQGLGLHRLEQGHRLLQDLQGQLERGPQGQQPGPVAKY